MIKVKMGIKNSLEGLVEVNTCMLEGLEKEPIISIESEMMLYGADNLLLWESLLYKIYLDILLCNTCRPMRESTVEVGLDQDINLQKSYINYLELLDRTSNMYKLIDYTRKESIEIFIGGVNLEEIFRLI